MTRRAAKPADLLYASVRELAAAYRARILSPVEVVKAHLARIGQLNGRLCAYITVTAAQALREARRAERDLRAGKDRGPLHGIPYAVKDQVTTKGIPTTAGSLILKDWVPREDATAIARMRDAGAILLGKLNMHEFAMSWPVTYPFGTPRNPWNPEHDPGGSSSGSGSAPAAGMATVTLGEDTGGSVRLPAAFCGIAGLRPTYGLVSRYGMLCGVWQADILGPLARSVEELALVLQAVAGHDPLDPTTLRVRVPNYAARLRGSLKGLRAGIVTELMPGPRMEPDVEDGVRKAIAALEDLGVRFKEISIPIVRHTGAIFIGFGEPELAAAHLPFMRRHAHLYGPTARVRLATALLIPGHVARWADRAGRAAITREVLRTIEPYDFLVTPTWRTAAPRIQERATLGHRTKQDALDEFGLERAYGMPFALAGLPALSVPCGFNRAGLPLAFQIIGKPLADDVVLRVGHAYQRVTDWHTRRPPLA
ncbi:MAG: amidase [Armatimonadetes bacterium]|nr:amidase [Armatimonadota bacterium]